MKRFVAGLGTLTIIGPAMLAGFLVGMIWQPFWVGVDAAEEAIDGLARWWNE